jgi:SWI/SNF-related matrix-associated actin-dependent regulator 1 of chromatin subfamily A
MAYAAKHKTKTIIVCPASLKLNWRNEILKFTNELPYVYKWKPTKKSGKINHPKEDSMFHIINYEALETYAKFNVSHTCGNCGWKETNLTKKYKECPNCKKLKAVNSRRTTINFVKDKNGVAFNHDEYGLVILDECHYIKSQTITRTRLVKKIFKDTPKKLLLTGTAIKSKPYEFFSILNFIDPLTWKNAHYFGINYCAAEQNNFGWNYDGASNLEELYQRISPYFLRRLKKDVLDFLPPKTYTNIPIELTTTELREYKKIEKKAISESTEDDDNFTHLSRIHHLKQFTSNLKLQRATHFIQDVIDGDEKIVVFSQYISITEKVAEHFGDKAVCFTGKNNENEKQEAVDRFMDDEKIKVFAGTIGAAGKGITLTSANILMFIDCAWTPGDMEQGEDRVHRASTTADKVQIIKLICQDTIDEEIEELLNRKSQILSRVLDGEEFERKEKQSIFPELVRIILNKKK